MLPGPHAGSHMTFGKSSTSNNVPERQGAESDNNQDPARLPCDAHSWPRDWALLQTTQALNNWMIKTGDQVILKRDLDQIPIRQFRPFRFAEFGGVRR